MQRFVASSGLADAPGELQLKVADALRWAEGEVHLIPPAPPLLPPEGEALATGGRGSAFVSRRLLLNVTSSAGGLRSSNETSHAPVMPADLVALLNTMMTCAAGVVFTLFIQYALVLSWRHIVNRKYYRALKPIAQPAKAKDVDGEMGSGKAKDGDGTPPPAPAKFFPFPKSLLWPTPLCEKNRSATRDDHHVHCLRRALSFRILPC